VYTVVYTYTPRTRPLQAVYTACRGRVRGVYVYTTVFTAPVHVPHTHTAVDGHVHDCVHGPCSHVHGPCIRSCTQAVYMHGHVHGLCATGPTWPVHDCVHAPFPRSVHVYGTCTRPVEHGHVYGRYTSVYTTVQTAVYRAVYGWCNGREHGLYTAVDAVVYTCIHGLYTKPT